MNSLDFYEFTAPVASTNSSSPSAIEPTSSSSSAVPENASSQPSLNEEVTQVIGQLGSFWGGLRKQSQSAFESARKDFGQVVSQAQKELEKLGQRPAAGHTEPNPSEAPDNEKSDYQTERAAPQEGSTTGSTPESSGTEIPSPSTSFLSRLQSSLPPNLTPTALSTTLQRHLPENLQHGLNLENANADFAQLRATLAENIQQVQQGTTLQQAEKLAEQYMHRGEALFKEAGEFLKDAVKVVPPEEGGGAPGVVWDGSDIWTTTQVQSAPERGGSRKGKGKETEVLFSVPTAAAKRADALLKKLRSDPDIIRQDPSVDEEASVKELWQTFVKEVDANDGICGEPWTKRIGEALEGHDQNEDVNALTNLRDQLVPAELTNDVFWTRYFFRVHQIEREEEQRKALLEGANQDEDDFTWEDEDEGDDERLSRLQSEKTPMNTSSSTIHDTPKPSLDSTKTEVLSEPKRSGSVSQTPVNVSPRESSEDSYDVVSSGTVSSAGGKTGEQRKAKEGDKDTEDGDESDWE